MKQKMDKVKTAKIVISITMAIAFAFVCYFVVVPMLKTTNYDKYFSTLKEQKNSQGLQSLKNRNENFVAWLECEDVGISLPIVVSPNSEKDYYLEHDFDNNNNEFGNPYYYQDYDIDTTTNTTIVGHSVYLTTYTNGQEKMQAIFGNLNDYLVGQSYYNNEIKVETFAGVSTYKVISAFQYSSNANAVVQTELFNTVNISSSEEFDEYIDNVLALSARDFHQTATYGDKFLTLYTCSIEKNYRTMVIAKLINN